MPQHAPAFKVPKDLLWFGTKLKLRLRSPSHPHGLLPLCPVSDPHFPLLCGNSQPVTLPVSTFTRNSGAVFIIIHTWMCVCVCILCTVILGMHMYACYDRTNNHRPAAFLNFSGSHITLDKASLLFIFSLRTFHHSLSGGYCHGALSNCSKS